MIKVNIFLLFLTQIVNLVFAVQDQMSGSDDGHIAVAVHRYKG